MSEAEDKQKERSALERHWQSFALGLILTIMVWTANSIIPMGKSVAVMEVQMGSVSAQIAGAYRAADAARDHAEINRAIDGMNKRMDAFDAKQQEIQRVIQRK